MDYEQVRAGKRDVARANDVRFTAVLRDYCAIEVADEGFSIKSHCPWGFEHADAGLERAFRVYPANNRGFCFAMHGALNPVGLVMVAKDLRPFDAARDILIRYGLRSEGPYRERFAEMLTQRKERTASLGSTVNVVEALHVALRDESPVTDRLGPALEELDALVESGASGEDLRSWYDRTRTELREGVR